MHVNVNNIRSQPPLVHLAILILSLVPLYFLSYQYRLRHPYGTNITVTYKSTKNAYPPSSPAFERKWLQTHLVTPFNPEAIRRYCNHTITWRPNLGFHLPDANGGIGNIKGNFLDFFFFAIEAGASTLVLPSMASRSKDDIFNVWGGRQPFKTFFDEMWFMDAMKEACPQVKIVREEEGMGTGPIYTPRKRRTDVDPDFTREKYVEHLDAWIQDVTGKTLEENEKVIVSMTRTLWDFDVYGLPWNLRRELGQLLRIRGDVREFAAEVVKNLGLKFGVDLDAAETIPGRSKKGGGFLGSHLRVESDAETAGFLNLEEGTDPEKQMKAIIEYAVKRKLSTIYVATGSPSDLARFRHRCATNRPPLNVTSKFDLLSATSAATLRKMTWDQQALVDMEVLQRSSFFIGMFRSSFSQQIAVARNQWAMDQGLVVDPFEVSDREDFVAFDDGLSRLTGWSPDTTIARIARGIWP